MWSLRWLSISTHFLTTCCPCGCTLRPSSSGDDIPSLSCTSFEVSEHGAWSREKKRSIYSMSLSWVSILNWRAPTLTFTEIIFTWDAVQSYQPAAGSSEMFITFYQTILCHIPCPRDIHLHTCHWEDFKLTFEGIYSFLFRNIEEGTQSSKHQAEFVCWPSLLFDPDVDTICSSKMLLNIY